MQKKVFSSDISDYFYISKYERNLLLEDLKTFQLNSFLNIFISYDLKNKTKYLVNVNFDMFLIKDTIRLILKNISNLKFKGNRKALKDSFLVIQKKSELIYDENKSATGLTTIINLTHSPKKNILCYITSFFELVFKALITYYKLINKYDYYILKIWLISLNQLFLEIIN